MLQLSFVNFKKDTYVLVEGKENPDRFFIIQSGHVKVSHQTDLPGVQPVVLGPGDFVGVISCMAKRAQCETCVAMSDVVCISVMREQYIELIEKNTAVALKIIRTFANRMRTVNEKLMEVTQSTTSREDYEQLFNVGSYFDSLQQYDIAFFAYYQYIKMEKNSENSKKALKRVAVLKPRVNAPYIEPSQDMVRKYPRGSMVFSEAQKGLDMFIIKSGSIKISKVVDGTEVTLAMLKPGDMFGEMALLERKPRSANAIATEDCVLMSINMQNFNQMVATQAQMVDRLTTTLSERLWSMQRQLANTLLRSNPVAQMTDMLALQIEKMRISVGKGTQFMTNFMIEDIAAMCGLSKNEQARCLYSFMNSPLIKIEKGKIFIPDCLELLKQAEFYRKQQRRQNQNQN
ncbi:MAG: cyclic nucleotide-binding domain-containing protein [Treponema sp.]|uniref:Crp/Fnr family transcriptional regulator n=1 Tax=Treponema sp. TaxID=166 RepID=UPI0025F7530C|nr:cyclic nucleotide-binding domain-containing protein [Treponema sp.]MBQ9283159.1 cyclic nucleotide-binding domain-containing protein [Treponema sp.]